MTSHHALSSGPKTLSTYLWSMRGHQEGIGASWVVIVMHGCCCVQCHQFQRWDVASHDAIGVLGQETGPVDEAALRSLVFCKQATL